ncbi:MAG: MerR family DNA-binding transcriptional regulator [Cumulibacter sp.]
MLIGEVSERSGVSVRMLRHYDSIGLLSPSTRTTTGYREYVEDDLRRLFHIEGLRSLGIGLRDVAAALNDLTFDPRDLIEQIALATRSRIARDEELLRRLERVQSVEPTEWSEVMRTIAFLRGLDASDGSARQRFALVDDGDGQVAPLAEAVLSEHDRNAAGALD